MSQSSDAQSTPTSNLFGGAGNTFKSDSSSIFGSNAFSSSFGSNNATPSTTIEAVVTTKSPILQTPSATITSPLPVSTSTEVSSTSSPSIFGTSTTPATGSNLFGSLLIDASKATSPTQPQEATGNIFGAGSLIKPDQSVFGQAGATTTSASTFGSIFSSTTASSAPKTESSSIFAQASPSTVANTNIFGTAQTATSGSAGSSNIFGSNSQPVTTTTGATNIFAQSQSTNIFAQAAGAQQPTGSLFSTNSFASPSTASGGSIFGGTAGSVAAPSQSPFGGTSIFGSGGQQATQTASIFGSGGNIFSANVATTVPQTQSSTSPFGGSSIFGGNQNQATFGGTASFSNAFGGSANAFGGSLFGQQQNQPTFGGGATFGSPKASIFGSTVTTPPQQQQTAGGQTSNIFEQLGQQQQSGNLFGNLATQPQPQQQQPGPGFQGSAFSSWR